MKLRSYQKKAQDDVLAAWAQPQCKNVLLVSATGSGKTVTAMDLARRLGPGARGVVQAHRAELVGQLSVALGRAGVPHALNCSTSTRRTIVEQHFHELGRSMFDPCAAWAVESVDTALRRSARADVNHVFTDECFPAGTMIDGVPIEQIRPGDTVRAFDEKTGTIVLSKVVRTMRNPAPAEMVRIRVAGRELVCTQGHPFFTQRGWVNAAHLLETDHVFIADLHPLPNPICEQQRSATVPPQEKRESVLHTSVRLCTSDSHHAPTREKGKTKETLRNVRESDKEREQTLFGKMQAGKILSNNERNKQEICGAAYDCTQPYATGRGAAQGFGDFAQNAALPTCKGREWKTHARSGTDSLGDVETYGVFPAIHYSYEVIKTGLPCSLSPGFCASWHIACDRGGRQKPCVKCSQSAGREKRCLFGWARLGSVEVFKRGNFHSAATGDDENFVFNFEVENQHTYIANGVIVHNCHHVLAENKWGRAATVYENARFLGVTATPTRADGVGLGIHEGGLFQKLVHGPGSASLMAEGFLCEYAIKLAISEDFSNVPIGANGEYLASAVGEKMRGGAGAKIVADAVATWLQHCEGKRTIVFATDIEHARDLDKKYRAAQVTSEVLTGEDTEERRVEVLRKFRAGQVLVLINVDLFGEGFDVPSCEVVQMCRPTASFSLFAQMVGRVLRLDIAPELHATWDEMPVSVRRAHIAASRKPRGLVIDHVGNFTTSYRVGELTHVGPPELFSQWTLDGRVKKRKPGDAIPTRLCVKCGLPYEAYLDNCPSCGASPPAPVSRSNPEHVAGCIVDYDPELLASLRAQIAHIDREPVLPVGLSGHAAHAAIARQQERRAAHHEMRNAIAWWAGLRAGRSDKENYRLFYYRFGLDVAQALALSAPDARKLIERIANDPL